VGALRKLQPLASLGRRALFLDGVLLIPLAALIAVSPRIFRGVSCGHDFEFHLISWFETQRSWSQGVLYPHWAQTPNWGAGEPRFVFYPPLTWMLGALLGYALPWEWVPAALTYLFLLSAGLATRALARKFLPGPAATLAGVMASATPYALFTAYERTAFSELAAAAFIPLLLIFAWRQTKIRAPQVSRLRPGSRVPPISTLRPGSDANKPTTPSYAFDGSATPLALILAAVWLTNAPAGVMASYLLAFAALAAAVIHRQWWPVLRAATAAPVALGLAAFYLVPAAYEQRWIAIKQVLDIGMRIQDSWLFARHASPDLALHDQVLRTASGIAVLTAALALGAFTISLARRRLLGESKAFWVPLAWLIPGIVLLQLPISAPIWSLLPKLQFLQFPWRWLMVLGIPFAIFLGAAVPLGSRRVRVWSGVACAAVLIAFSVAAAHLFFQSCDDEDQVGNQIAVFQAGTGVEGTDEYAAAGSDNSLIATGLPDACLVSDPTQDLGESDSGDTPVWYQEQGSCDDTFTAKLWHSEHKLLQIDSDHDGFLILRLSRYPAWHITVNGAPTASLTSRQDGLTVVPVHSGPSAIEVRWASTPDVLWGRGISASALLLLAALWIAERRLSAIRLSS
jgi:hypothetical protein